MNSTTDRPSTPRQAVPRAGDPRATPTIPSLPGRAWHDTTSPLPLLDPRGYDPQTLNAFLAGGRPAAAPPQSWRRLLAVLGGTGVVVLAALALHGHSAGRGATASTSAAGAAHPAPGPLDRAVIPLRSGSVRLHVEAHFSTGSGATVRSTAGTIDGTQESSSRFDLVAQSESQHALHLVGFDGGTWLRLDAGAWQRSRTATDLAYTTVSRLAAAGPLQDQGTSTHDGELVHHFRTGSVAGLPGMGLAGADVHGVADLWVRDDGTVEAVSEVGTGVVHGQSSTLSVDMHLWDYGSPIAVQPPNPADVAPGTPAPAGPLV